MAGKSILIRSKLKKAQAFLNKNKLPEAKSIYEQIYRTNKNDIDIGLTLAIINRKMGLFRETETVCRHILISYPDNPMTHHILGSALQCLGNMDGAIASYQTALRLDPSLSEAHYFIGDVYKLTGQAEAAAQSYRLAVKLKPDFVEALNNLGAVLISLHQLDDAREILTKADKIRPNCEQVLCNFGDLYLLDNKLEKALTYAEKTLKINKNFFEAYCLKGKIHNQQGVYDKALDSYNYALQLQPENEAVIGGIAQIFEKRREFDAAKKLIQPFIEKGTNDAGILLSCSAISRQFGEEKKAMKILEDTIDRNSIGDETKLDLHSELGKHYDALQDYANAFTHYEQANLIERKLNEQIRLRTTSNHHSYDDIEKWFDQFDADYWKNLPQAETSTDKPVFIVGLPRSGTSLTEQILATHPDVYGAGELTNIAYLATKLGYNDLLNDNPGYLANVSQEKLTSTAQKYLHALDKLSPNAKCVTNKMPTNFWHLGLISRLFPDAKVIHMNRDPRDTCLSMYFQRFGATMTFTTDLKDLGKYCMAYNKIMNYWHDVLDLNILDIKYENLVDDQENITRKLIEFCSLEWSDECLCFYKTKRDVNTPSYDQVRKPIYKKSVARWKNYEQYIQTLIKELDGCL